MTDYETIFEKAEDGIAIDDPETGTFLEVNQRYAEMLGYDREELVGMEIQEVSADDPAFDQEAAMAKIQDVLDGDPQQFDWLVERKDGSTLWVEVSLKRITIDGEDRLVAFVRDVSDRKAYQRQIERQADELEFFNSLLRHDVLNAITVIRSRADLLAGDLEGDRKRHAETIVEWSDNVTGLVRRVRHVLNTLTDETPDLATVNLSKRLQRQVQNVEATHPEVAIETDVEADYLVEASDLLEDVIKNVLTNAIEHNDTENLRIVVATESSDGTVTIRIADNGRGIPDEQKEAVFRRGATGHVKNAGSGFGLFFVDAMVTAYGGTVRIEDNEMGGATVVLELPKRTSWHTRSPTSAEVTPPEGEDR